jgi:Protein of unknown function (DUF541)
MISGRLAAMRRMALVAGLVFVVLPGQALAQPFGPFPPPAEEYGPGITVTGNGLARVAAPRRLDDASIREAVEAARPQAAARAVADARGRAESIAAAIGASLGQIDALELEAEARERRPCRRSRRTREVRCTVPPFVGGSVEVTFEVVGGARSAEGARELSAYGTGFADVENERETSPAIRRALFAARLAATPEAARAARARVELAAQAAGVRLGPLFSIVEPRNPYGYQTVLGVFGPGRFCGMVRRAIVRRDPETGSRRVVRLIRRRRCFSPNRFEVRLEATYLAAG